MSRSRKVWQAMLLLGAALAATAQAAGGPGRVASSTAFHPPLNRPMLLSRTLWRSLADGKHIVAIRRYRVRFERHGSGWRVDGELVSSEIDAPERLRAFAELERTRPDDGLFPLFLDADGRIVPEDKPDGDQGRASVEQAIALAAAQLGSASNPGVDAAGVRAFLQQVQTLAAAAVTTEWPVELFRPDASERREERRFTLPDGSEGVLTSEVAVAAAADRSTMASCERRIITEIAGDRRTTRENWTLEPIAEVAAR